MHGNTRDADRARLLVLLHYCRAHRSGMKMCATEMVLLSPPRLAGLQEVNCGQILLNRIPPLCCDPDVKHAN